MKRARSLTRRARLSFGSDASGTSGSGDESKDAIVGADSCVGIRPSTSTASLPRGMPGSCEGRTPSGRPCDGEASALLADGGEAALRFITERRRVQPRRAYAWMDSDDESCDVAGGSRGGSDDVASPATSSGGSASPRRQGPLLPASLGDVETFGEFVRVTPAIMRAAATLPAAELAALCQTAARLKYFDTDLFGEVFKHVEARLRSAEFDILQVTAVVAALVELNAYNAGVFSAAATSLLPRISDLSKAQRLQWIKLFAAVGHTGDEAFAEALRFAPLPGGEDGGLDDEFFLCWEWVRGGFCPRGKRCRWAHPPRKGDSQEPA
eukprot:TRINITY_DN68446_c0_g1_i1.p1 TRINITY_DN68446_c0_g1~~TRINITY_DN68446_c0_g1_i1.p1  ORF type:complete len:324 (+),score=54.43 TRINITY_DN68446_c0_g1_i1:81-1052(+)